MTSTLIRVVSFVETVCLKYPSIEVSAQGSSYLDIEWSAGYAQISEEVLTKDVLQISKIRSIDNVTKEMGKAIEVYSLFLSESSVSIQSEVYALKARAAQDVLDNVDILQRAGMTDEQIALTVVKPAIIIEEAEAFGMTVIELANVILSLYNRAQAYMGTYIGQCETWRRVCKAAINGAESIEALESLELPTLPSPPKVDTSDYSDSTKDYLDNFKSLL